MSIGNAFRYARYTVRAILHTEPRHRHQRGFWKRNGTDILAAFGGAIVLTMPAWMILLGII